MNQQAPMIATPVVMLTQSGVTNGAEILDIHSASSVAESLSSNPWLFNTGKGQTHIPAM